MQAGRKFLICYIEFEFIRLNLAFNNLGRRDENREVTFKKVSVAYCESDVALNT